MATARERLLQALFTIISPPYSDSSAANLRRLLNNYRVQAKPGIIVEKDLTARDLLAEAIVAAWKEGNTKDKKQIAKLIARFRMQLKQGSFHTKSDEKSEALESQKLGEIKKEGPLKDRKTNYEGAYFRDRKEKNKTQVEDSKIAGGPKETNLKRGLCPKCRSLSLVLARTHSGEIIHSCIYCGYHSYPNNADAKLDLPMAAELLQKTLGDPDLD